MQTSVEVWTTNCTHLFQNFLIHISSLWCIFSYNAIFQTELNKIQKHANSDDSHDNL